jgi:hypothetical protein
MAKQGVRVHIEFVKQGGRRSRCWVTAPAGWGTMTAAARRDWVRNAAGKHSPGATAARAI